MARPPTIAISNAAAASARRLVGVVLLVEDEPSVRTLMRRMLEMYGLIVLCAEGPDEAILILHSRSDPVDVLLTDMQLPGMSGIELANRVRTIRPGLPVVYISGYPREEAFPSGSREGASAEFIQKPFTPTQLGDVMRRVLERAASDTTKM